MERSVPVLDEQVPIINGGSSVHVVIIIYLLEPTNHLIVPLFMVEQETCISLSEPSDAVHNNQKRLSKSVFFTLG
jgi:hypothetical protein